MEKISEKVRSMLEREEKYLLEVQKTVEHQLAVLKAEQVVLERQIKHHELHQDHSSADHTSGASSSAEDISDSDDLPQLRLDISDSILRNSYQDKEEEEEEEEDMED